MSETVPLKYPITVDGTKVSNISLRRPKVGDMLSVENDKLSDAEKEIQLFANLSEMVPESLHELDMADYAALQETYQRFLS